MRRGSLNYTNTKYKYKQGKMTSLKPKRTQYVFDLSGVRFKSRAEILRMQQQWNTFEQVENYNDVIYQRFELGLRDKTYYTFKNREEMNDYRIGQELHVSRYPGVSFTQISNRPMPTVAVIREAPSYSQVSRVLGPVSTMMTATERTEKVADTAVYIHVSTFNAAHVYKYNFTSQEERLAYHRAERELRA